MKAGSIPAAKAGNQFQPPTINTHEDWRTVLQRFESVRGYPASQSPAVLVRYGKALSPAIADCLGCQTGQQPITLAHMTFHSLPFEPRKIVATEARLNKIYEAAKLGLKGDALALASGMLPTEYRQLCELDPIADMAALKGKADGELEMSTCLHKAAKEGDAKAALAILQHSHGWVAKQSISIDVDQRISIIGALRQAESRVIDVLAHEPSPTLKPQLESVRQEQT